MKAIIPGVIILPLAACATLPVLTEENYAKVEDILATVECEIRNARNEVIKDKQIGPLVDLSKLAATAELNLDVVQTYADDGSISLVVPFSNAMFKLGLDGGLTRKNTRKTTIKNEYSFSDLSCVDPDDKESRTQNPNDPRLTEVFGRPVRWPKRLHGKIGLEEWLLQAVYSAVVVNRFPQGLTYVVEFDVVANAKAAPELTDTFSTGEIITGKVGLDRTRQRTHTVTVAIVSAEGEEDGIRDVVQRDAARALADGPKVIRDRVGSDLSRRLDDALLRSTLRSIDVD